ncbi:uncharacterized protein LOC127807327 [Diospyros lotus]|uniref:uncharacterized protein LOC127807327 n=1 Tax=Diospyros lotus TaxID=55363 RepID=UPI00224D5B5D|nr:uncharacterized protein LOC127807327 [Diospyros lotus]
MVNPFICGAGGFHHQEEEEDQDYCQYSSQRKLRRSGGISLFRTRDSKNPYANRGLDKFSALLAELEHKKKEIYTQKDSQSISFVRFVFSDSNNLKPIVVRLRGKRRDKDKDKHISKGLAHNSDEKEDGKSPKKKRYSWKTTMDMWRPCWYLPAAMILIMLLLAVFGRSFAILCTSFGWYLVPAMARERSSARPAVGEEEEGICKKNIVRGQWLSSSTSTVDVAVSPRRRKSW